MCQPDIDTLLPLTEILSILAKLSFKLDMLVNNHYSHEKCLKYGH